MSKQELCDNFYRMDNLVTVEIRMDPDKWEELRNAEPRGRDNRIFNDRDAPCAAFSYTKPRYNWYEADEVVVSGTEFSEGGAQILWHA